MLVRHTVFFFLSHSGPPQDVLFPLVLSGPERDTRTIGNPELNSLEIGIILYIPTFLVEIYCPSCSFVVNVCVLFKDRERHREGEGSCEDTVVELYLPCSGTHLAPFTHTR